MSKPAKAVDALDQIDNRELFRDEAALVGHDLRAAIGNILGQLALFEETDLSAESKERLARIDASARMVLRLTELQDARDARVDSFSMSSLLQDLKMLWSGPAEEKGLSLVLHARGDETVLVRCNHRALERLLSNLLDNAIKFTEFGKVTLAMELLSDTVVQFVVTDTGCGFSEEAMARAFVYGGRPDTTQKPGSGLGLYIAKQMAQKLGGDLTLRNTVSGASVTLTLEIVALEKISEPSPPKVTPVKKLLLGRKILLVEDNATNQIVAERMLAKLGAEVVVTGDGVEGLEAFTLREFDLVLLDIEMPRKSGLELIHDIRRFPAPKNKTPLVALTAYVLPEHRSRITAAGVNGIVAKPLADIHALGAQLCAALNKDQIINKVVVDQAVKGSMKANQTLSLVADSKSIVDQSVYYMLRDTVGDVAFETLQAQLEVDFQSCRDQLEAGFEQADIKSIRSASHVLISLSGAVGAQALQEGATTLNGLAHNGSANEVLSYQGTIIPKLDDVIGFIILAQKQEDVA